ncbi:MAG: dihydrodipicolinate synthase family protein, partial [Candidatus Hydrogenedentes bacterium]|nr:dihydrodipicolinate synthase family protein [Candidatus Hydrogenedentota bacterium]
VIAETAGRVPVIGGASAPAQAERIATARAMRGLGCAGVLVSIPFESNEQYRADVCALAEIDPGFLMLQDWDFTGDGLPLDLIVRLFDEVPAFRCLKIETAQAGGKYSRVLEATGGRLHVSGGWAVTQLIEGLDRGIHAVMPTGLHRAYVNIIEAHARGDRESACALFHRLAPILMFSNQHLDISIHFFKRLLQAQGIYKTSRVREPILPFDVHQSRYAASLILAAIEIEAELSGTKYVQQ